METVSDVFALVLTISFGFVCWFVLYGLTLFFNGASLNRKNLSHYLWQDFIWAFSRTARGDYVRLIVSKGSGYVGEYSHEEIIKNNLYCKVGSEILPGIFDFIGLHVVVPCLPTIVYILVVFLSN